MISSLDTYVPNDKVSKCMKQKLIRLKEGTDKAIVAGKFSSPLLAVIRITV
jgi:hypothetical protein